MNDVKTARKLFWWRSVDNIADAKIPDKRKLNQDATVYSTDKDGFMSIPEGLDEELPFA